MKRKHAGAKSKKHGCSRCHTHAKHVEEFSLKSGRRYALCNKCITRLRGGGRIE